ncbi:MAG: menaquinone biosynthesis protein [Bacillota bacterium]
MISLRIGQVDYLNCLPVYHALEEGILPFAGELVKGVPTTLNEMFLNGGLEITPISSIEYARHQEKCFILPGLSIAADGPVRSILLFSGRPVPELNGQKIYTTRSSATSVALLQILLAHFYRVKAELLPLNSDFLYTDFFAALAGGGEGVLLIGDPAMAAHQKALAQDLPVYVTDLGAAWKEFTGKPMIYALWVVRSAFALAHPHQTTRAARLLWRAKEIGLAGTAEILPKAHRRTGLPISVIKEYFQTISYDFSAEFRAALLTFYHWASKTGLLKDEVRLRIWGEG